MSQTLCTVRRKFGGKRIPMNIPSAPMDNISFHYETGVQKWKYVFQIGISCERDPGKEYFDCKERMKFLKAAGLMKIVTDGGPCYEKLVKEFIVNINVKCNVEGNKEYRKVYDRGKCVKFSFSVINDYLVKSKSSRSDKVPSIDKIAKEIIGGQVKQWPKKCILSSGSLSVKYAILNRIGVANWTPTYHSSGITTALAKLILQIGTKAKLNFGEYMFEKVRKHVDCFSMKLFSDVQLLKTMLNVGSGYPKLMKEFMVKNDGITHGLLNFRCKLFVGTDVIDISLPNVLIIDEFGFDNMLSLQSEAAIVTSLFCIR
ncbi:uncharacterized protein LOC127102486 [Lathyrus oleraceus]|uniref:uncharacterized protein LOC127102486 n=1 Tax=Pisum sativum TaxID=3888 RepID=UPI0021D192F0|nr:uncharacterized protein LOC127102486 [Pisum sativum]